MASIDTEVRAAALLTLRRLPRSVDRDRILVKLARESDPDTRIAALEMLDGSHGREVAETFLDALLDPDPIVQRQGASWLVMQQQEAVAFLDTQRVTRALLAARTENGRFHIIQLIEFHVESGGVYAFGPIIDVALEAEHPALRQRSLELAFTAAQANPVTLPDVATISSYLEQPLDQETRQALRQIRDKIQERLRK